MSKGISGHFKGTKGDKNAGNSNHPLFNNGHVTYDGIADNREKFMDKSVDQIAELLKQNGYKIKIRNSKHSTSTAKVIVEITNSSKDRNIKQVQVSSDGSKRHGGIPYVKISTSDEGKIKVINGTHEDYKTDGEENARLIFRRKNE